MTRGKVKLHYEIRGEGHPLLLIAGLGSDHMSWLGVIRKLAARYQVVAFDNRGCGRSDSPDAPYSIRDMADDAARLLDEIGSLRCHVVGHSMGGYIAQELAIRHPEYVDKLVLEGTAACPSARAVALLRDLLARLERTRDYRWWIRQWSFWLFSPKTFERKAFIETFIRNATAHPHRQPVTGFERQVEAIASFDARAALPKIHAPALVLSGEDDILVTPRESAAMARAIPRSRQMTLPGLAHCMHIENPDIFVRVVSEFLG